MTSFFKRLVDHRSKSPQKRNLNSYPENNGFPHNGYTHRNHMPPYAPICYLPLPPSPIPVQSSKNGSSHSNESFGVHSWNTEPREVDDTSRKAVARTKNSPGPLMRARSHSPRKLKRDDDRSTKCKSKSPQKTTSVSVINQLDYLNSQCHLDGCRADIVVHISVSRMTEPSPSTQFRWFVESTIPCPALKDITDETLETCMRLSKRFQAKGLELRCIKFLLENCCNRQPIVALCWLNWSLKHGFDAQTQMALLPSVACLSLNALERHRHMITDKIYSEILTAKLRGTYEKAVQVFVAIHELDHFSADVEICPRCKRTKEGLKVKVFCDPCRKQIGCDRCNQEGCELSGKSSEDMQAFFRCPHKLIPLNDSTDDCQCQTAAMAQFLGKCCLRKP